MRTRPSRPAKRTAAPATLELLDRWVTEESDPALRDRLLDLRAACTDRCFRPVDAVRTFLRVRPLLQRSSYWTQHRIRRALERRIVVEVTTPDACWQEPLRLAWNTLPRTLDGIRREVFEQGTADWNRIRIRLVPADC